MRRIAEVWIRLDWADWPEITSTGLLAIAVVMALCEDYFSAALTSGAGALLALLAIYRARP